MQLYHLHPKQRFLIEANVTLLSQDYLANEWHLPKAHQAHLIVDTSAGHLSLDIEQ